MVALCRVLRCLGGETVGVTAAEHGKSNQGRQQNSFA
jgi:hypothetical protein